MEIRLEQIAKSFDQRQVIQPTTLTIQNGSFTTLLGPSGCGKTTLLRMIAGLETPDDGEIWLDDICVFSKARKISLPPEKRNLGFVFQDVALWPHMTVLRIPRTVQRPLPGAERLLGGVELHSQPLLHAEVQRHWFLPGEAFLRQNATQRTNKNMTWERI